MPSRPSASGVTLATIPTTLHRVPERAARPRLAAASLCALLVAGPAVAQVPGGGAGRELTLDQALALAVGASEQVAIARAGLAVAKAGEQRARSERRPRLDGAVSYDRTLASEFDGLFDNAGGDDCPPLMANPAGSLAERVAELERAYDCPPSGGLFGGDDAGDLPFGQANTWRIGVQFSQALYAGGRIRAQEDQARAVREGAEQGITAAQAQAALEVAEAFLDAALSDRLLAIAQATVDQADQAYRQTLAQREAGRQSEFERLRAEVARDTLTPQVVSRQAARRVAYLRLERLLDLPLGATPRLVADFDGIEPEPPSTLAAQIAAIDAGDVPAPSVALASAEADVRASEAAAAATRALRRPSVFLQSTYGLVNYRGAPAPGDFRDNWTVGASVTVPLLNGGRLRAEEQAALAGLEQARQQRRLAGELASLDREAAREQLSAARAAWQATAGTVRQAERAYEIADLRYREGLSTQLELSDARLLLQQAQLNRAVASRDLQIARIRAALLPGLPLGTASRALALGATLPGGSQ